MATLRRRPLVAALLSVSVLAQLTSSADAAVTGGSPKLIAPSGTVASTHSSGRVVIAPPHRIPVPEPPQRSPLAMRALGASAAISKDIHRLSGKRLNGPPMLRPLEIDHVLAAARSRANQRSIQRAEFLQALPGLAAPGRTRGITAPANATTGKSQHRSIRSVQPVSGTGINRWWRYKEQSLPGGERAMVNVSTGNFVLQDDDMSVPHQGIAMGFRRTYNSQSGHDVNSSGASGLSWDPPGMYGNGWTNTFDAHLTRSTDATMFYVNDSDGTRYDFNTVGNGVVAPVAGNYTTLTWDGNCGWLWTKKSGTTYYFYRPSPSVVCSNMPTNNGVIPRPTTLPRRRTRAESAA